MGFIDTIRDYPNRTLEEMRALGVNDSMIHEDFMIGTPDLSVTAHCRDGRTIPCSGTGRGLLTEIPLFRRNTAKCGALRFWSAPFSLKVGNLRRKPLHFRGACGKIRLHGKSYRLLAPDRR